MITSPAFSGKRYAVLGLARSGLAAAEALLASGAHVVAWDRQDVARDKLDGRAQLADPLEIDLTGFDGIVVSPGVPLNTHPITDRAREFGVPVIGDIELFAMARPSLPSHTVIGITGTNGKSTTTALVDHVCRTAGLPVQMGGNIGIPIMAQDPLAPNDNGPGVYVLELSSYQLDLTRSLACEATALLNITPDHLDRYDGFEAYAFSKGRLFAMQRPAQFAVFGCEDEATRAICAAERDRRADGRVLCIDRAAIVAMQDRWPALQGPHNLENAAAALALAQEIGVDGATAKAALESFRGLPHRMEVVAAHRGVLFINDSKATNQASTAPALAAFPPENGRARIHWIVGGLPKEDGLGECEGQLANIAAAYTIGEAGPRFAELLEGRIDVVKAELLCEAVNRAVEAAQAGDIILLSPACASFDQFRDFEKRGEHFREIVAMLTGTPPPMSPRMEGKSAA